jgi:glycosyltransferase involved in cell wall biosynthesis
MARPVILTRVAAIGLDGSGYSIRDRVNCRLVPPGDKEALRQAILELWEDREQGIKLGRAGRITIEREYTTQRFAERLAAVLKQVCN